MNFLELEQQGTQWRYRVFNVDNEKRTLLVDWQTGLPDKNETIKKAIALHGPFTFMLDRENSICQLLS